MVKKPKLMLVLSNQAKEKNSLSSPSKKATHRLSESKRFMSKREARMLKRNFKKKFQLLLELRVELKERRRLLQSQLLKKRKQPAKRQKPLLRVLIRS